MPRSWNCLNSTITPPIQSFETENDQDLLPKKKLVRTSKIGTYSKTQKLKPFKIIFFKKTKRCFECVGTTIDGKFSTVFQETKKKKKKSRRRKRKSRVKTRGKWGVLYIAYWGNQQSKNAHRKF